MIGFLLHDKQTAMHKKSVGSDSFILYWFIVVTKLMFFTADAYNICERSSCKKLRVLIPGWGILRSGVSTALPP